MFENNELELRVFEGKQNEVETLYLKLRKDGGDVDLVACDKDGEILANGYLLGISPNGKLKLYSTISSKFGFDLDDHGRLTVK